MHITLTVFVCVCSSSCARLIVGLLTMDCEWDVVLPSLQYAHTKHALNMHLHTKKITHMHAQSIHTTSTYTQKKRYFTMFGEEAFPFDLQVLKSFKCLRPLKMVSRVPSKSPCFGHLVTSCWQQV